MTHLNNSNNYNPVDYWLIVFINTGEIDSYFRIKSNADKFLNEHPFKEELKIIVNPKYDKQDIQ